MSENFVENYVWRQVRDRVACVNEKLANIIDLIEPDDSYRFICVNYPYGARIFDKMDTIISLSYDKEVSLTDDCLPKLIRDELGYRYVPVGIILDKMVEVYFETSERVMPMRLYHKGELFGLWQLFDPPEEKPANIWNLSAGARSIFLLPTISDASNHARLRRTFDVRLYAPKALLEHHNIFVEISRQTSAGREWLCPILYFGKKWAEEIDINPKLSRLWSYWLTQAWRQSHNCRDQVVFDKVQEQFSQRVAKRNLKPKPYVLNTINHLLAISKGLFPGFIPAVEDEEAAPVKIIQDAYLQGYLLKQYIPTVMQPTFFYGGDSMFPVYYSLSFPTLLDIGAKSSRSPNILADLRELRMLMEIMQSYFPENNIHFKYYHSEQDKYGEIFSTKIIPDTDKRFLHYSDTKQQRIFPYNGPFLRGCVQISS